MGNLSVLPKLKDAEFAKNIKKDWLNYIILLKLSFNRIYSQLHSNLGDFTEIVPTPELLLSSFRMCSAKIMNLFY